MTTTVFNSGLNSIHQRRSFQLQCYNEVTNSDYTRSLKPVIHHQKQQEKRRCEYYDLSKELIPYKKAWDWQKSIVKQRQTLIEKDEEDLSDTSLILQHYPVYTLGTASSEEYLNFNKNDAPYDIYRTERGGEVTYHGPGQLVMYPIINLRYHKMELHWYLRALEEVVIRVLSSAFSIKSSRVDGLTGTWIALNVTTDLTPFQYIVPCGIKDRQVGSVESVLEESVSSLEERGFRDMLNYNARHLMDVAHELLLREFSEVFQLTLHPKPISDLDILNG
ncbi:hypothetical protein MKX01_033048 [Papaver californicum]|nr:hypothetical protein MKX01_033048 [Papaver californicum]